MLMNINHHYLTAVTTRFEQDPDLVYSFDIIYLTAVTTRFEQDPDLVYGFDIVYLTAVTTRFEQDPGMVYGFGVEGEWLSEYVPSEKAEFYYTKNGTKVASKPSVPPPCSVNDFC